MMVDADYPCDPPSAIFVLPDVDELRFPDDAVVLFPRVKEAMHANLDRAIALQGINFKCSGHEFPLHLSAQVVLESLDDLLSADHEPGLVVIKLRIVSPETRFGLHIAAINSIENFVV